MITRRRAALAAAFCASAALLPIAPHAASADPSTYLVGDGVSECLDAQFIGLPDAFAAATAGDTLQLCAGVYDVSAVTTVPDGITIAGPNAGLAATDPARGPEAEIGTGWSLAAADVTLDGLSVPVLTVSGSGTTITGTKLNTLAVQAADASLLNSSVASGPYGSGQLDATGAPGLSISGSAIADGIQIDPTGGAGVAVTSSTIAGQSRAAIRLVPGSGAGTLDALSLAGVAVTQNPDALPPGAAAIDLVADRPAGAVDLAGASVQLTASAVGQVAHGVRLGGGLTTVEVSGASIASASPLPAGSAAIEVASRTASTSIAAGFVVTASSIAPTGFADGIRVLDEVTGQPGTVPFGASITSTRSSFAGVSQRGVVNGTASNPIDATCSWWGSITGPTGLGTGTGRAVVGAVTAGPFLQSSILSAPCVPSVSIDSVDTVIEGKGGTAKPKVAGFTISLSRPATANVTVSYTTVDGTATANNIAVGGADYVSQSGQVVFTPTGSTTQTLGVLIPGDTVDEFDETFSIQITSVVNGTLGAQTSAETTILDDDAAAKLTVVDKSKAEGSATPVSFGPFTFKVKLNAISAKPVSVTLTTADGTAKTNVDPNLADYVATTRTITFTPGETEALVDVSVAKDRIVEPAETFFLNVTASNNVDLAKPSGKGTILNDD